MRMRVEFEVEVPDDLGLEEAMEWLNFSLGATASMQPRHPHMDNDLEAVFGSVMITRRRSTPAERIPDYREVEGILGQGRGDAG